MEGAHGSHLAPVRGELVPYLRLREWFGVPGDRPPIEQIAIANTDGVRVGFVVDHVVGQHQTVIKTLGNVYEGLTRSPTPIFNEKVLAGLGRQVHEDGARFPQRHRLAAGALGVEEGAPRVRLHDVARPERQDDEGSSQRGRCADHAQFADEREPFPPRNHRGLHSTITKLSSPAVLHVIVKAPAELIAPRKSL